MKRFTVTKISLGPYIKWASISYLILGILTATGQATVTYVTMGPGSIKFLFWTYVSLPIVYLTVGVVGSIIIIFLYNAFNRSIGSYTCEVDEEAFNNHTPPPPPDELR